MNFYEIARLVSLKAKRLEGISASGVEVEELVAECAVLRAHADILETVICEGEDEDHVRAIHRLLEKTTNTIKKNVNVTTVYIVVPDKEDAGEGES